MLQLLMRMSKEKYIYVKIEVMGDSTETDNTYSFGDNRMQIRSQYVIVLINKQPQMSR